MSLFLYLQDVCKTTIFYADNMHKRVLQKTSSKEFEVTQELCLAINNIDYVLQYIRPFVDELGMYTHDSNFTIFFSLL